MSDPLEQTGPSGDDLVRVENMVKHFPVRGGLLNRQVATVQDGFAEMAAAVSNAIW